MTELYYWNVSKLEKKKSKTDESLLEKKNLQWAQ